MQRGGVAQKHREIRFFIYAYKRHYGTHNKYIHHHTESSEYYRTRHYSDRSGRVIPVCPGLYSDALYTQILQTATIH